MVNRPKNDELPEEWVRYDTVTLKPGELPAWMKENDEAFRKDPAVIDAAERAMNVVLLEAIPPAGRSTHDRSALARELSYTNRDPEPRSEMEFRSLECPCGQRMVKRAGHDCKCLNCGELVLPPEIN